MPSFSNAINATKAAPARLSARAAFRTTCPVAHAPVAKALRVAGPVRVSALAVGDKIPSDASLAYFDAEGNMNTMDMAEACASKKVVLFAVPGAFTPTCSLKHLPGFIEKADEIKAKGVDLVGCVSVNDAFVMDAWGKSVGADNKVMMLADGSAIFTKALGVELDLADKGLGTRSRRYSMLIENGEVTVLNLEVGGAFTISGAEEILEALE